MVVFYFVQGSYTGKAPVQSIGAAGVVLLQKVPSRNLFSWKCLPNIVVNIAHLVYLVNEHGTGKSMIGNNIYY
jgi:hypothetical protein